ncbi:MAG: TIM barrel protein [Anaerolineae bacterium]|nr:TIM barrel protein [Anaerolineae bacterium]
MIRSGLVSITFRQLSPEEIVSLVAQAGLDAIEWGGDIHVPHGDVTRARTVRQLTVEAGLEVAAYGSYYRVGHGEPLPFGRIVETAVALDAPLIRVWAGKCGSAQADDAYWAQVVEDSYQIADLAAQAGIRIAYEYHANTLTDTTTSALKLLQAVAHPHVTSYWQPPAGASVADNLAGLEAVLPWLTHLHVFSWRVMEGTRERLLLAEKAIEWRQYLQKAAATGRNHIAMIEFVKDDMPENFLKDASTLKQWLAQ